MLVGCNPNLTGLTSNSYWTPIGFDPSGLPSSPGQSYFIGLNAAAQFVSAIRSRSVDNGTDLFQIDFAGGFHFPQSNQNGFSGACAAGTALSVKGGVIVGCQ